VRELTRVAKGLTTEDGSDKRSKDGGFEKDARKRRGATTVETGSARKIRAHFSFLRETQVRRCNDKRDIERLDDEALRRIYDELRKIQLTTASPPRLGFIIDDTKTPYPINPDGMSVNLYGYVSMAVAAIQTQSREIEALRAEVAQLRREHTKRLPVAAGTGR
jgi:hypothetical protein